METKPRSTPGLRSFEDFIPSSEWVRDEKSENLLIKLPGFNKEQIKVQIDNYRNLKTSGERPLGGNKWSRFSNAFRIPENLNISEISAKFQNGVLHVMLPKLITRADPQDQPARAQEPPATESKPGGAQPEPAQKTGNGASPAPEPTTMKQESGKSRDTAEARKEKEKDRPKEVAGGEKGREAAHAEKKEPPATAEKAGSVGGGAVARTEQEKDRPKQAAGGEKGGEAAHAEEKAPPPPAEVGSGGGGAVARKEKEKDRPEETAGGEKGGEAEHAEEKAPPAAEKVGSGGGGGGAVSEVATARQGVGGVALRLANPRQMLVNVAVAIMVLVVLGIYMTYKMRKTTVVTHND